MKKTIKAIGLFTYVVSAIIYFATMIFNYSTVSSDLDGWHGFSSKHALLFVIICLSLGILCIYNMFSLLKDKTNIANYSVGILLIGVPIVIFLVTTSLQGNVDSDFQYLLLRTSQGFENTYLMLIILSIISFVSLLFKRKEI